MEQFLSRFHKATETLFLTHRSLLGLDSGGPQDLWKLSAIPAPLSSFSHVLQIFCTHMSSFPRGQELHMFFLHHFFVPPISSGRCLRGVQYRRNPEYSCRTSLSLAPQCGFQTMVRPPGLRQAPLSSNIFGLRQPDVAMSKQHMIDLSSAMVTKLKVLPVSNDHSPVDCWDFSESTRCAVDYDSHGVWTSPHQTGLEESRRGSKVFAFSQSVAQVAVCLPQNHEVACLVTFSILPCSTSLTE